MSTRFRRVVRTFALISLLALLGATGRPSPASAGSEVPFRADYQGAFALTFGPGVGAASNAFSGSGHATHLGRSALVGLTALTAVSPGCFAIAHDRVTLTAANGDTLVMENAGLDCLDTTSTPGTTFIRGTGTYTFIGGTGRFDGAAGSETFAVTARVREQSASGATGVFDSLSFTGTISTPGQSG